MPQARTLVLYHYFELDATYKDNFLHFLLFGYCCAHDYLIIIAGDCSVDLPDLPNVRYLHAPNRNGDYGGFAHAIGHTAGVLDYAHYVFVNCSVRGPFTAPGASSNWTSLFTDRLTGAIGVFGSSITILSPTSPVTARYVLSHGGTPPISHVQTMAYAMRRQCLIYLYERGFYNDAQPLSKDALIQEYELRISQLLLAAGWNIGCLLPEYNKLDYRQPHVEINPSSREGDCHHPQGYFGRTPHPYEVLFAKTNRGLYADGDLERLAASALAAGAASCVALAQPCLADYAARVTERAQSTDPLLALASAGISPARLLELTRRLVHSFPEVAVQVMGFIAESPCLRTVEACQALPDTTATS